MKKIIKILLATAIIISLSGCRHKNKLPNEDRGTNYKYDFINYFDVLTYGENNDGYIMLKAKDIYVDDFESESEYISVKKDLDSLGLTQDTISKKTELSISKTTGLSNGEVVTFTIKHKGELYSNMNIEPFDYTVENLKELKEIDLFSDDVLFVYALSNSKQVKHTIKSNADLIIPKDILEDIQYKITTDDIELRPNQTILTITAFLKNRSDIKERLAYNGLKANLSCEKVLSEIVEPTDNFDEVSPTQLESVISRAIIPLEEDQGRTFRSLGTLQKLTSNKDFEYVVTYLSEDSTETSCYKANVQLANLEGQIEVMNISFGNRTPNKYYSSAYENSKVLVEFNLVDLTLETPDEAASYDELLEEHGINHER